MNRQLLFIVFGYTHRLITTVFGVWRESIAEEILHWAPSFLSEVTNFAQGVVGGFVPSPTRRTRPGCPSGILNWHTDTSSPHLLFFPNSDFYDSINFTINWISPHFLILVQKHFSTTIKVILFCNQATETNLGFYFKQATLERMFWNKKYSRPPHERVNLTRPSLGVKPILVDVHPTHRILYGISIQFCNWVDTRSWRKQGPRRPLPRNPSHRCDGA